MNQWVPPTPIIDDEKEHKMQLFYKHYEKNPENLHL